MTIFAFIGLGVLVAAVALYCAIADSMPDSDWLEKEDYWYK